MHKVRGLKLFYILCFVLASLILGGCNEEVGPNDDPPVDNKVNEVIEEINLLPEEILKSDISQVNAVERMYKALTDEQKAKVYNYEYLEKAIADKNYLQDLDENLYKEFSKIEAYLNQEIPDTVTSLEDQINLPSVYTFTDERQSIRYRISYTISDVNVINGYGEVSHQAKDTEVKLSISVKCSYNNLEQIFEKDILVERNLNLMFDHQILVAYWYGRFQELTDVDYESIDIINYSFAQIAQGDDGWYIDGRLDNLKSFSKAKEKGLKVCLSLGGWHDDKSFWDTYALAASTEANRVAVANAILEVMIKYDLDGVDMDWEYPTSKDKNNFTLLMKQIRKTLKEYNPDYIVTAAIPAGSWIGSRFDLASLNDALDLFYIMTYDLDDGMDCNHLSSLADAKDAVSFFSKNGVDLKKIVIGSAFYGRCYEGVEDNGKGGLGQRASAKDEISFDDVKEDYLSRLGNGVTKYYDESEEAYYLYDATNKHFITYEDVESVTEKWEYVVESGIGGLMYWSYNNDKSNTLMQAINAAQKNSK